MSPEAPEGDGFRPVSSEPADATGHSGIRQMIKDILAFDRLALAILVIVPVSLTLIEYYGMPRHYQRHHEGVQYGLVRGKQPPPPLAEQIGSIEVPGPERLRPYIWWSLCCLLLMVVVPMITAYVVGRTPPTKLGLKLKGTGRDGITYLILFAVFAPVVYWASTHPGFQRTYPFYTPEPGPRGADFVMWEVAYCAQFFAVEFFFRGFMVIGLKKRLGWASVLVMLAPYCMIHDYKPMLEGLGAIGAGLVLGVLAYRTETIIYGWLLHFSVALSMDLMSLSQQGRLPF